MGSSLSDADKKCCDNPKIVEKEYKTKTGNKVLERKCKNCGYTDKIVRYW